jgi:hypothetical protein
MDPAVADRLWQSILALNAKIFALYNPNLDVSLYKWPQPNRDVNNLLFLQNLRQLRTNLINIWNAANDPTDPNSGLDVATIGRHLRTNLQQSAFTDANGAHAAGLADIPASPFTVNSGKSSGWFDPYKKHNPQKFSPLYFPVPLSRGIAHSPLSRYSYDIYEPTHNPTGRVAVDDYFDFSNNLLKEASTPTVFAANFTDYIFSRRKFPCWGC